MSCLTTSQYWDCDCETDYIHHSDETICLSCITHREDGPDSHIREVIGFGHQLQVICTHCETTTSSQSIGDGCHTCLKGVMQLIK